jgi:hypothetical protein
MKKLKCIKEVPEKTHVATFVTVGNVYEQENNYDDTDDYYILDDSGIKKYYDKWFFEVVS